MASFFEELRRRNVFKVGIAYLAMTCMIIKSYVREAIKLAKEGRQIAPSRKKPLLVPAELKKALGANRQASENFKNMRLGLQREYADYITDAKREDTKLRRLEKIMPMIGAGSGLHDKYR